MSYTQLPALLMAVMLAALPQARPDFSGAWEVIDPPPAATETTLPPSDLTIQQLSESLAISRTAFGRVTTLRYSLDGREDKNVSGAMTRVTRTTWVGPALQTSGRMSQVTSQGYASWSLKETMRLDASGRLIAEHESVSQTGEVFRSVVTYRKTKGDR